MPKLTDHRGATVFPTEAAALAAAGRVNNAHPTHKSGVIREAGDAFKVIVRRRRDNAELGYL